MTEDTSEYWDELARENIEDADTIVGGAVLKRNFSHSPTGENFLESLPFEAYVQEPVLDAPCGYGRFLVPIAKKGKFCIGLDLSRSMLKRALKNQKAFGIELGLVCADFRSLPFKPNSFRSAFCLNSLYYVNQKYWKTVLNEFAFSLREGGNFTFNIRSRSGVRNLRYGYGFFLIGARIIYELEKIQLFRSLWTRLGLRSMRGNYTFFASRRQIQELVKHQGFEPVERRGFNRITMVLRRHSS